MYGEGCFVTIMKVCVCLYTRTTYENVCIYIPERGIFIYWWGGGGVVEHRDGEINIQY